MRKEDYKQILGQHAMPLDCRLISRNFIMQQVTTPSNHLNYVKGFHYKKKQKVLKNMKWQSQPQDLNPIKLL